MHELSLIMSMIEKIEELAEREGGSRVLKVVLEIGELSGVDISAMEFAFPVASDGTLLENARLIMKKMPVEVACETCGQKSIPELPFIKCNNCDSKKIEIIAGKELIIKTLEIE